MMKTTDKIRQSLVWRLAVSIVVVVASAVTLHIFILSSQEELFAYKLADCERVGGVMKSLMIYDMVVNNMHDFQSYLCMIPIGEDIYTLKLYDEQSTLKYAIGDSALNIRIDRLTNPSCSGCHMPDLEKPLKQSNIRFTSDGTELFQVDFPLINGRECVSCHSKTTKFLGNLLIEMKFTRVEKKMMSRRKRMIFAGASVMVISILIMGFLLQNQVVKPLRRLMRVIEKSKRGEFTEKFELKRTDEIGYLVKAFNEMMENLTGLQNNLEAQVKSRTEELESSRTQLLFREHLASLGRLAAGIAHELGNPLTGISSIVQLVKRRKKDDEFVVEQLNLIHEEINRLSRLSRQLVDLARPEDAGITIFNINMTLQKAYQIARLDRRLKKHKVTISDSEKTILVRGNEDAAIQIIMNLLFNGSDAMEEPGEIYIDVSSGNDGSIEIRVRDSGKGIPEEIQKKIFDPFFSSKGLAGGTGLGLSVSHSLARSFSGSLTLEKSDSQGTIFLLKIPSVEG